MKPTALAVVLSGILLGGIANASEHNIINNPGFEDKGLGWSYWFANIRSDDAHEALTVAVLPLVQGTTLARSLPYRKPPTMIFLRLSKAISKAGSSA